MERRFRLSVWVEEEVKSKIMIKNKKDASVRVIHFRFIL